MILNLKWGLVDFYLEIIVSLLKINKDWVDGVRWDKLILKMNYFGDVICIVILYNMWLSWWNIR